MRRSYPWAKVVESCVLSVGENTYDASFSFYLKYFQLF